MAMQLHNRGTQATPSLSNIPKAVSRAVEEPRKTTAEVKGLSVLNATEVKELAECEEVVSKGWTTFVEVGRALTKIRDKRLYRSEYETFDTYCLQKLQYRRAHAYRLIGAAQVVDYLSPIGDMAKPTSESLVRPLLGLNQEKAVQAWKKAAAKAGNGRLTAKLVHEAVLELQPKVISSPLKRSAPNNVGKSGGVLKLLELAETYIRKGDKENALETLEKMKKLLKA